MKTLIEEFYTAFEALDAEGMVACYHDNVQFEDPAFGLLKGERAKNMWRMLCHSQKGKDFKIVSSNIRDQGAHTVAHWEAYYTFSKTGRKVHNKINAYFEFEDGKIKKHIDSFDVYEWSKQAMGLKGMLLGRTQFFKRKIKEQTNSLLDAFEAKL